MQFLNENDCHKYERYWFQELMSKRDHFYEPFLEESTVEFIKFACDNLKQDTHVFIMTVEILENYIMKKNQESVKIEDEALACVCVIFLCSKFVGEQSDLRAKNVRNFLSMVCQQDAYSSKMIKSVEFDVFKTLEGNLPLYCKIDDLNTFLVIYMEPMKLKDDMRPLCVKILELFYVSRRNLFTKMLGTYKQNEEAFLAFKYLICNKLYIPIGILLCALKLTRRNFLDLEQIYVDLSYISSIHQDHLLYLSNVLYDYILSISNEEL